MQIREIHIERFGKFTNFRLTNIGGGLNVIYGKNEFGKTTLLEFVRWVLFGFESRRKRFNAYEPVAGGEHAGTLVCEMYNGERIFISRKGGTREGQVSIRTADWEGTGQANLETFIGHASRKIFKNIYAFALEELQSLDSLMEDEIKHKILGAGMGLGKVSLADVEEEIRNRQDQLFLPRGQKPVINQGHREIKKLEEELRLRSSEIDRYDELTKKIWVLEKMCKTRESNIESLAGRRRMLEMKRDLFSDFIDLENKSLRLKEVVSVPDMDAEHHAAFEKFQTKMEDLIPRLEEEKTKLRQLKLKRDSILFNQALVEREADILQLRQLTELVRAAQADQLAVAQERNQLNEKIRMQVEGVHRDWDETRMLALEGSEADKEFLQRQEQALYRSEKFLENVKNRLELHKEQQVTETSRPQGIPGGIRLFAGLMCAVGLAGAGYALFASNMELGIFMGVVLAAGLGLYIWLSVNRPEEAQDELLENLLQGKVAKAEQDMEAEQVIWRNWLQEKGLGPETSPARYREIQTMVRGVKEWVNQREGLDERIARMQNKESEAEILVKDLSRGDRDIRLTGNLGVNIEMVCRHYEETREKFLQARDLDAQIKDQEERTDTLAHQLNEQRRSILQLLESAQVDSEESFLRQWYLAEEKKELEKALLDIQARIQKRVGLGEAYHEFLQSMSETYPDQLEQELTETCTRLNDLQEQQDQAHQEIGKHQGEAAQLASREDMVLLQNEREARKEQLMSRAREWAGLTLALDMLEQAKTQYEKNRQPHVFQAAGRMFSKITEGNYYGVEKPLDSDDFRIVTREGGGVPPGQLSRGTREQLYLSMRFGLIEDYETRAEPLPLMMDDVFVNFDDNRREHVLDILRDFARDRQVIILSCHEHLLETYHKYGAKQVNLQEN